MSGMGGGRSLGTKAAVGKWPNLAYRLSFMHTHFPLIATHLNWYSCLLSVSVETGYNCHRIYKTVQYLCCIDLQFYCMCFTSCLSASGGKEWPELWGGQLSCAEQGTSQGAWEPGRDLLSSWPLWLKAAVRIIIHKQSFNTDTPWMNFHVKPHTTGRYSNLGWPCGVWIMCLNLCLWQDLIWSQYIAEN